MSKLNLHNQVRYNKWRTILLVFVFLFLVSLMGVVFGLILGNLYLGVIAAVVIGMIYSFIMYRTGDSVILKMSGAKPVTKAEYPHLYHAVEGLSIAAGIPTPKAYVIKDSALNAFATGKDPQHASVAVTTGLLERLNRQELEGVLAHEISHIKNYDIRVMMLATVLVGIVTLIADFILYSFFFSGNNSDNDKGNAHIIILIVGIALALLAPLIANLIKLAISRNREYLADTSGALLTRYPPGLASALKKIKSDPDPLVDKANKASAHLFISTPFRKKAGVMTKLFSTHPEIDERIKRLEAM